MHAGKPPRSFLLPAFGAGLALAVLAAPFWPPLFAAAVASSAIAGCALVLTRRSSRRLRLAIASLALWVAVGFAGAWLLRGRSLAGLAWVLAVLYLLPLPVIPWLYWLTFGPDSDVVSHPGPRVQDPSSLVADQGPQISDHGGGKGA